MALLGVAAVLDPEIPFSVLGEHVEHCRSGRALYTETKERRTWMNLVCVCAEALEYRCSD